MATGLFKTVKGKRIEKTPEEVAQEQREGQEFIQERERRVGSLTGVGLTERQARQAAQIQLSREAEAQDPALQARLRLEQQQARTKAEQDILFNETERLKSLEPVEEPTPEEFAKGRGGGGGGGVDLKPKIPLHSGQVSNLTDLSRPASLIAQLADIVRTGISGKKTTRVQQAEQTFADASALISNDIELVKNGVKPYTEVKREFERARAAITSLESTTKGIGTVNLRYWLDNGRELEAQIAREKELLESLSLELEAARNEARTRQARINIGLQNETPTQTTEQIQ